jgi:hypothetical protein
MVCQFKNGIVCPSATSEAGARGPRFGLAVATTTSRRDNKDQMIRPLLVSNIEVPFTDGVKYLGVSLDSKLLNGLAISTKKLAKLKGILAQIMWF